jgi:hypothetical protein
MTRPLKKINFSLVTFKFVFFLIIFLLGGLFALNNWQPFSFIMEGFAATYTFVQEKRQVCPVLLKELTYNTVGVSKYNHDQAYNGLTALQGTLPGGTQIRLIDMHGNEIHRWPVSFYKIWPNPEHLEEKYRPKTDFNYHTQGLVVLPDGAVIINIGDKGTAKLSKCGNVEWTVNHMTHHSITPTAAGGFWIPSRRSVKKIPDHLIFPGITREKLEKIHIGTFHSYENLILLVDENGEMQKEFSVLQSLYDGGFESEIYDAMLIKPSDPTHINDIEIVTKPLADKIPNVNTGDLLVSIRQMHMLAIFDQLTWAIKWHFIGPWIRQHDPDITQEGNIVVFNNGHNQLGFNRIPGSNLIELDPGTGKTRIIYPRDGQQGFYTDILGAHELLPNGNMLIVESRAGRVFEVNHLGNIVWEYVQPYDETHASLIAIAQRFNKDYFTVDNWNCD